MSQNKTNVAKATSDSLLRNNIPPFIEASNVDGGKEINAILKLRVTNSFFFCHKNYWEKRITINY